MSSTLFTRRDILKATGLGALSLWLPAPFRKRSLSATTSADLTIYVGTYTSPGKSKGIYAYKMNPTTGELTLAGTTSGVADPSFVIINRRGRRLYAVNETLEFQGKPGGALSSFAIDRKTLALKFLNQQPTLGGAPCHVTLDGTEKFAIVANYVAGNIAVIPVHVDGSLGPPTDLVQHKGKGVNPKRQEGPHAHCVMFDRANRFLLNTDLGLDKIMIYRLDKKRGKLVPNDPPWVDIKPGSGPRHLAFHPNGRYVYLISEMGSTMTAFAYDENRGRLHELQSLSTLPKGFSGTNTAAEVQVSPSGKFLYGSNRGDNSIVAYKIDKRTGKLAYIAHESCGGRTPRNFVIDPSGKFLLAANQDSDNIVVFSIDPATGRLSPTGHTASVGNPVCLAFLP